MTTLMRPKSVCSLEILPAVGVAFQPQLQTIMVQSFSFESFFFEDAEQLKHGSGETTRKGGFGEGLGAWLQPGFGNQ